MADFITKANPDEEFNNGGSTLGKSGGAPVDGPQSPLSETDQSDTIEDLQFADTADSSQSGPTSAAADGQMSAPEGYVDSIRCTEEHPLNPDTGCCGSRTEALLTLEFMHQGTVMPGMIEDQQKEIIDDWKFALAAPLVWPTNFKGPTAGNIAGNLGRFGNIGGYFYPAILTWWAINLMSNSGPMGKCGCWTPVIGVTDLFGGGTALKIGLQFIRWTKGIAFFRGALRNAAIKAYKKLQPKFISSLPAQPSEKTINDMIENFLDYAQKQKTDGLPKGRFKNPKLGVIVVDPITGKKFLPEFDMYKPVTTYFKKVLGISFSALATLSLMRPKQCFGENVRLNPYTCECECASDEMEECGIASMPQAWLYDLIAPNVLPTSEELKSCGKCDCNLDLGANNLGCKCTTCESGYTWKTGRCDCSRDIQIVNTGNGTYPAIQYTWAKQPGKCIRDDVIAVEEGLGKTWDEETCSWQCPAGSDVAENRRCGLYARLNDNLGAGAPSKEHYLYRTGCNCVCDGRQKNSSNMFNPWPPLCPEGYEFNSDPLICSCVDICSDPPDSCRWVVECAGCGDMNECVDNPDCGFYDIYFRTEEFDTEAQANTWISENGHIYCVPRMVKVGTTTPFGDIDTCP